MSVLKVVAIVLIVAGIAGLALGSFTYTRSSHESTVGPFHMAMHRDRTVTLPLWAGIAAIAAGALLLVIPRRA